MTDYTKLIEHLRFYSRQGMRYGIAVITIADAAYAIEDLQHRVIQLEAYMDVAEEEAETLYSEHEKLKQQLPKHGEWYTELFDGDKKYQCSNCLTHWDVETRYCPFCGAKMFASDINVGDKNYTTVVQE